MNEKVLIRLMPWLVTIGLFVLWELVCVVTKVETFILPAPTVVFESMVKFAPQIAHHSLQTLMTTTAGFSLCVVRGALFVLWELVCVVTKVETFILPAPTRPVPTA